MGYSLTYIGPTLPSVSLWARVADSQDQSSHIPIRAPELPWKGAHEWASTQFRQYYAGLSNLRQLHGFMSHQVDICRVKSTYVALGRGVFFFLTIMLGFANVSSPSMMGCGQLNHGLFTDLQRPFFTFGFSLGESHGFSGPGQTLLNSDAIMAREGHPQGAPLPDSGSITGVWPNSLQLPVVGACFDVQCRTMTYYDGV